MPIHPDETARAARPLDVPRAAIFHAPLGDDHAAALHWQALLDAGLIGNRPAPSPEIVAQRAGNDALFRRIAADRRAAERADHRLFATAHAATALHASGDIA